MNTSPASNPFTGLKGALAGLMSGGWLGLLLGLLFRRRIAPMLAALESLFAQWKAGTLPMPAAPAPGLVRVRGIARAAAAGRQAAVPGVSRPRRQPAARAAAPRVVACCRPEASLSSALLLPAPAPRALRLLRRRARCTTDPCGKEQTCTP
jgi:predicted lipid-binding transport protein (Tim44 family)